VIFQSSYTQYPAFFQTFHSGAIASSLIDSAVARVLRVKFQLGLFEHPYVNLDTAAGFDEDRSRRALARRAASEAVVLLRNSGETLPLRADIGSLAVIGTDAVGARLGGYTIDGASGVSILDALRERLGQRVRYAPGPGRSAPAFAVIAAANLDSLRGEYFDNIALAGEPRTSRDDANIDFHWTFAAPASGIPVDWYSVRWTGILRAPPGGVHRIGIDGTDGYRLYLDDRLLIDDWRKESEHTTLVPVDLAGGSVHRIRLEFYESVGSARVRLVWDAGVPGDHDQRIDSSVALARRSDAAIVVVGIEEGEFRDRASLALPGHQEQLIRRVAATRKPTVVVIIGGSAVTMSRWIDSVGAVLMAWYPGEEGGRAVADVLLGEVNPAGRLPIDFPLSEGQLPLYYDHEPTGRGDDYLDLTGKAEFPFGFGLSYARFEYSDLRVDPPVISASGVARASFTVKNAGTRAGDEVPQLYVKDVLSPVARPVLALKGFARIHLRPGEHRIVTLTLSDRELCSLNSRLQWTVEPGLRRVLIGASSNDIRLRGDLVVR
jgi:beta-glucosidase